MLVITATDEWRMAHPGAVIGLLEISGVDNSHPSAALEERKRETEAQLRERYRGFTRADFLALPRMAAYEQYYKRFNKTYHVQLQVESLVLKGKSLPAVSPLVDANFTSEVVTFVLTAGHDVARLQEPVVMDVSRDGDVMTQLNGATKPIRAWDMVMRDAGGVSCTILYGQDNRSPITPETRHVLYVVYAPPGIAAADVNQQLDQIETCIRLFAPQMKVEQRRLL